MNDLDKGGPAPDLFYSSADICKNSRQARQFFYDKNYPAAYRLFCDTLKLNPEAWWLAMEAIRSVRAQRLSRVEKKLTGQIFFSPDYTTGNSYQANLYSAANNFDYTIKPVGNIDIQSLANETTLAENNIFHQHWIKEFYWHASSFKDGVREIQRKISKLKALKNFRMKIAWTLHNLIDHDANELQKNLCVYTHREMASVSDIIYVHTKNSLRLLSEQCETDLTSKVFLLEHPLYDNFFLQGNTEGLPKEIQLGKIGRRKVLVHLGMIKPYKGVPDLLKAFDNYVRQSQNDSLYLIIGGKIYDPRVSDALKEIENLSRERLSIIDRRLSEKEMSALLRLADASVTPYKNILISGSYYLSTTFGKPTIAPRIGMFQETIVNYKTGIIYDGTVTSLTDTLIQISKMGADELAEIGAANLESNKHLTVSAISKKYFNSLASSNA